jgi:hypothetical protein
MRRVSLWLVLAVALVVAGCGSLGADTDANAGEGTVTPVAVPTKATTPTPDVAPGLASDRVVNYSALVATHAAAIRSSSHTYRKRVTRRYPNGTVWREYTTFVQRNRSALRYRYNWSSTTGAGERQAVDRWRPGNRTYVARTDGDGTAVGVEDGTLAAGSILGTRGGYAGSLDEFLQTLDVDVTGAEIRNGERRYRLAMSEPQQLSPSRNVTFVGYVTPEGVFTDYRLTYRIEQRDIRIDVTVTAAFEDVGSTTVTRPPWADRLENVTAGR